MNFDTAAWSRFGLLSMLVTLGGCLAGAETDGDEELAGTDAQASPIIGGSTASAYPEAALVNMSKNGQMVASCSGAVIAPKVVLTAGHCVFGFTGWSIATPFAGGQKANSSSGVTYDWQVSGEQVDPKVHDIGLVFLNTPINLASYPAIAASPVAAGGKIVNIGRINNGSFSSTALFVSQPMSVSSGSSAGYPYDYVANEVIQPGDSGGPDLLVGTHTIVAVNSGAGGGTEVLARTDLLASWIQAQIDAHGGGGQVGGGGGGQQPPPPPPPNGATETEPNNTHQTANALSGTLAGTLAGGDQDWFTWSVASAGVAYDVSLSATGDGRIQMWKLVNGGYSPVANTSPTKISHSSNGAGTYIVVAHSPSGSAQSYSITLQK